MGGCCWNGWLLLEWVVVGINGLLLRWIGDCCWDGWVVVVGIGGWVVFVGRSE